MSLTTTEIIYLLESRGHIQYGREAVSQLEHALQTAHRAEVAGESDEIVVACLIHDLGHLLYGEDKGARGHDTAQDDQHQCIALPYLRATFSDGVLEPIRLHVDAKRYLCLIEPQYEFFLSPESRRSLQLQGGIFSEPDAEKFIAQPFSAEAVRLRRYDDRAKIPGKPVPALARFHQLMDRIAL